MFLYSSNIRDGCICNAPAERNKEPILQVLRQYVKPPNDGNTMQKLLEISSGSGQHVAHIAPHFPFVEFQPTEYDRSMLESISLYIQKNDLKTVKPPLYLNAADPIESWADGKILPDSLDYVLNVNLVHVSPWACSIGLFSGCSTALKPGGILFTYGAYADNGVIEPQSNIDFDKEIRARNSEWGLRDITKELVPLAKQANIVLLHKYDLPANNKLLVWQKQSGSYESSL